MIDALGVCESHGLWIQGTKVGQNGKRGRHLCQELFRFRFPEQEST